MSNDKEIDLNLEDGLSQFFVQNNTWSSRVYELKKKVKKQKQEQNVLFPKSNQVQVFINTEAPNFKTIRTQPLNIDRFSLKRMFTNMSKLMEQIDHKTGIVSNLKVRNFLDVCCAPGGCSQYVLSKTSSTQSKGTGYTLAKEHNGIELLLPKKENRFQVINLDITKKLPEVPPKPQNDLVLLNGWKLNGYLETGDIQVASSLLPELPQPQNNNDESNLPTIHNVAVDLTLQKQLKSHHRKMLMISQLLTGLTSLTRGGNLLLLMKYKENLFYASVIEILEKSFDKIHVLKPAILESPEVTDKSLFAVACINFKSKEMVPVLRKAWSELSQGEDVKSLVSVTVKEAGQLCGYFDSIWMDEFSALMKHHSDFDGDATTLTDLSKVLDWNQVNTVAKKFSYASDCDTNGIVYFLTGGDTKSPNSPINVSCSATGVGSPSDFIARDRVRCWTSNHPYAWYCVDLGAKNRVIPTHYTVGYGSSGTACMPRNWILQGANKISRDLPQYNHNDLPQNDAEWQTLSIHSNDASINQEWGTCTWSLNCRRAYRYLRIVQTGPNSFNTQGGEDSWSLVLVMNRFEIYGYLLPDPDVILMTPKPVAVQNGNSSGLEPYLPPVVIRADASLMREVHELLAQLVRQQNNDTKAEKVRVHEIVLEE